MQKLAGYFDDFQSQTSRPLLFCRVLLAELAQLGEC